MPGIYYDINIFLFEINPPLFKMTMLDINIRCLDSVDFIMYTVFSFHLFISFNS